MKTLGVVAAAVALAAMAGMTQAASIAVQFAGAETSLSPTDTAGVAPVAQDHWNPLTTNSFSNVALHDDSGAATTATLSGQAAGTYFAGRLNDTPGDQIMTSGELFNNFPNTYALTFAGIPYARYDVYAYADIDAAGRSETIGISSGITFDSSTATYQSFTTTNTSPTWVPATSNWDGTGTQPTLPSANYAFFGGLTGSSFTMNWGAPGNGGLNGVQIVEEVPEPATLGLLGLGAMGLLARRRRIA